jgi:hypothetical protein
MTLAFHLAPPRFSKSLMSFRKIRPRLTMRARRWLIFIAPMDGISGLALYRHEYSIISFCFRSHPLVTSPLPSQRPREKPHSHFDSLPANQPNFINALLLSLKMLLQDRLLNIE